MCVRVCLNSKIPTLWTFILGFFFFGFFFKLELFILGRQVSVLLFIVAAAQTVGPISTFHMVVSQKAHICLLDFEHPEDVPEPQPLWREAA
jgi:hypothetical protein